MGKIRRTERFKDEIKEAKMYKSLVDKNIVDSKSIQDKKKELSKLDSNFFSKAINNESHQINTKIQLTNLDHVLKSKIHNIQSSVSKDLFEIPNLNLISTKLHIFEELQTIKRELMERLKSFESKIQIHDINFSGEITALEKQKEELLKKEIYFEEKNLQEISKVQANLFDRTNNVRLGISKPLNNIEFTKPTNIEKKMSYKMLFVILAITTIIFFVIFRGMF